MTTVPYAFDDAARAIRILDPDLPAPWINYLSNGRLSAFVSQCAGGPLWWKTPISYRITRYRSWTSPDDGPGFWTYVRNADGTVWSPSFRPCRTPLDDWEARHEPGFSRFRGRKGGLEAEQTLFDMLVAAVYLLDVVYTAHTVGIECGDKQCHAGAYVGRHHLHAT